MIQKNIEGVLERQIQQQDYHRKSVKQDRQNGESWICQGTSAGWEKKRIVNWKQWSWNGRR